MKFDAYYVGLQSAGENFLWTNESEVEFERREAAWDIFKSGRNQTLHSQSLSSVKYEDRVNMILGCYAASVGDYQPICVPAKTEVQMVHLQENG